MSDVIAAIATGSVVSAIGILRLSGSGCGEVAGRVFRPHGGYSLAQAPDRKLVLGTLTDSRGRVLDECLGVYTRGPNSYTGEDTVELQCHGSPAVLAGGPVPSRRPARPPGGIYQAGLSERPHGPDSGRGGH